AVPGEGARATRRARPRSRHERAVTPVRPRPSARRPENAGRKLRESEDRCRLLFDQNPHPMWLYDAATLAFLEVNDAAVQRYGYSRHEFLAMRSTDLCAPPPSGSCRHRVKSGEMIDVELVSHDVVSAGRPAVMVTAQ